MRQATEVPKGSIAALKRRMIGKVAKSGKCLVWTGTKITNGYGVVGLGVKRNDGSRSHKTILAHRAAWIIRHGSIPDGMLICHHCDNPPCVKPSHLFVGTAKDNMQDMIRKGRQNYTYTQGEAHPLSKLTRDQARAIFVDPRNDRIIGEEYGVSKYLVYSIQNRVCWKHATGDLEAQPRHWKRLREAQ